MVIKKQRIISIVVLSFLLIAALLVQAFKYWTQNNEVSIWVFDIGQGDSIFIDADVQVLIDGGPDSLVVERLSMILPFWDRSIDLIVNTHPHADHLTGLITILNRYLIGEVWVSGQIYETSFSEKFTNSIEGIDSIVSAGKKLWLDDDVTLEVIWPIADLENIRLDNPNDGSIVLLVECFDARILLTGDIGTDQELAIMNQVGDIDILKVGHQGSNTSSSIEFLDAVDPEVAIISVGENDYGHPHDEVLYRLNQVGSAIYRTDLHSDVRVICSKEGYEIKLY